MSKTRFGGSCVVQNVGNHLPVNFDGSYCASLTSYEHLAYSCFSRWLSLKWMHWGNVLMSVYGINVPNLWRCVHLLSKPFLGWEWVVFLGVSQSAWQTAELVDSSHLITSQAGSSSVGSLDNNLMLPVVRTPLLGKGNLNWLCSRGLKLWTNFICKPTQWQCL